MSKYVKKETSFHGATISLETGKIANQAHGAVFARMGDTVVLATVVTADAREGIDFFPLTVEYMERLYAGGLISSSRFLKREGRAGVEEILNSRLIDRSLRPLFSEDFINDVEIIITVLSYDKIHDPAVIGITAASAALCLAGVPFAGPVAGVKIGRFNGKLKINPSDEEMKDSDLDLMVSGTKDAIIMLEAGAQEVPEETILEALELAHTEMQSLIKLQAELKKEAGKDPIDYKPRLFDETLMADIEKHYEDRIKEAIYIKDKKSREKATNDLRTELLEKYAEQYSEVTIIEAFHELEKKIARKTILKTGMRPDGRKTTEIRPIMIETGVLPRTHGSAIFQRGETQALSIVTLGSLKMSQVLQGLGGEELKRYMHHYNFPGFATGEKSKNLSYPGRREIGHGALAERALVAVLPSEEEFPYAIRVVSEITSSNGSSSMASTCGSTLSLLDAGVPLKAMVSGIAMGLVMDEKTGEYTVLSDIQGLEDHFGDMDFKVTGTEKGVTAIQMDNKLKGITLDILRHALGQAREGRLFIMGKMKEVISKPRAELSEYAPRIETIQIPVKKIGEIIGPQGKNIKAITERSKAEIEIDDFGRVKITSSNKESRDLAKKLIEQATEEAVVGKVYEGKVSKIMTFGAFVDVSPSITGLVHVSEMAEGFVKDPNQVVKEGQNVRVMVIGIDDQGRINMSMKRAAKKETLSEE